MSNESHNPVVVAVAREEGDTEHTDRYGSVHMYMYTDRYFLTLSFKMASRSNHNPVPMNVCRSHILVFKYHSPMKGIGAYWRKG